MSRRRIAETMLSRARIAFCLAALLVGGAGADPVIAERGQDQITIGQARALIASAAPETRRRLTTDPAALKDFLRNVLVERAVLAEAEAAKWDQRPEVMALLTRAHDQLVAQSYLASHAVVPPSFPSEAELQAAYTQNKAQFMQPRSYHLEQLFISKPAAGTPDDGKTRLTALRRQIEHSHAMLADTARHASGVQYLDMGWSSEKQLVPGVKEAVAGLLEGAMAGPVCVENGCHLIKLVATRPAGPTPLLELREGLIRAMRQQKLVELEQAYASAMLAKQPVAIDEIQLSHIAP